MGVWELINIETFGPGKRPFVHFDCHGNEDGIEIISLDGNEELINWKEISSLFRKTYRTSKRRSVLCLSSYQSLNAVSEIVEL